MHFAEDTEKGLYAKEVDGRIIRFARMKYDANLRLYRPDSVVSFDKYIAFPTKKQAIAYAKSIGWPCSHIEAVGTRLSGRCWGIREDFRSHYFMANYQ